MSGEKKAVADLVEDLGRRTGAGLEECVLLLLAKGRAGIGEVASALDASRGEAIREILQRRAPQVVEFLGTCPGGFGSEAAGRILAELPTNALMGRAWAFVERGEGDAGVFLAEVARSRDPGDPQYYWLMARVAAKKADLEGASRCFDQALSRAKPQDRPAILQDRARTELALGDLEAAWRSLGEATSAQAEPESTAGIEGLMGEMVWRMIREGHARDKGLEKVLGSLGSQFWRDMAIRVGFEECRRVALERNRRISQGARELGEAVERLALSGARAREEGYDLARFREVESRALQARRQSEDLIRMVGEYPKALDGNPRGRYGLDASDPEAEALAPDPITLHWGQPWEVTRGRLLALGEEARHLILEAVPSSTGGQLRVDEMEASLWNAMASVYAIIGCLEMLKPLDRTYHKIGPVVEGALERLGPGFRLGGSAPVMRLGSLPEVQMDKERFAAALTILTCRSAQASPGIPVGFSSALKEESGEIEITIGPVDADGRNNWVSLPGNVSNVVTVACDIIRAHDGEVWQKGAFFRISVPQSTVERDLSRYVPAYTELREDTRQALKAAEAILQEEGASRDLRMSAFLFLKALEIEMEHRLQPYLERHRLLAKAVGLWRDQSSREMALREAYSPVEVPQDATSRLGSVLKAIDKDRIHKEARDWNSLGLLVTLFTDDPRLKALGRDLHGLEALKAWAGGSSSKGRPPADIEVAFRRAREATLRCLAHLAGLVD
ncbi:MAG: hypothetical protein AB1576_02040 [Bacillota bacterium]